jgi:tRNA-2-methylthio-N6-dimethylallyladenosine synthase
MTMSSIARIGEVEKLMPYLHLPVQSGSNRILKAMNRSHTPKPISRYSRRCARAARTLPLAATSSSASRRDRRGFRGDAADSSTSALRLGLFVQVQRAPGTPAALMEDQIPREIMDDRLQRLQARINLHQLASTARRSASTRGS